MDRDAIRARREKLTLTLDEAAKRAGLASRQRWWQIEAGVIPDPRASMLWAIARALGCRMDELMIESGSAR